MRNVYPLVVPLALLVAACGSADGTTEPGKKPSSASKPSANASSESGGLARPTLREGYTRFETLTVEDLQPGDDITRCQYVMAPVDRDMDILDVIGRQSKFGHHAAAFSYTPTEGQEVGAEVRCMNGSTEFSTTDGSGSDPALSAGGYLGAVGPIETRAGSLPDGVAFRLKKGQGIMMNLHYINTGLEPARGEAYIDMKLVEIEQNRPIAALFLNFNSSFSVAPNAEADSSVDCVAGSDVSIIMMSNHMHEYGTRGSTQVIRKGTGVVEMMRDDPTWTEDMANNPTFTKWTADSPFVLHQGDTIRTSCSWQNTTAQMLGFPREMCISAGFALASGDAPKAPACFNGAWVAQGI